MGWLSQCSSQWETAKQRCNAVVLLLARLHLWQKVALLIRYHTALYCP